MAPAGGRSGDHALAAGITAVLGLFVPGIGDFIALAASIAAMALGAIGLRQYESGRSPRSAPAAVGVVLGALAALGVGVLALASVT
ncbi:hypothetical protein OEB99_10430 [Actinotalea sp. M2MS4P-6]|uniref:hypothetical protein n=1 Tax=Actinotalea sp. M2MS4P-6 TaxID=2983762 RepID=UPI0021E43EC9|nr:hypothetical protein [Actinotalea sp. M2MS4P-6]MCV2394723.1 hypothetical protein [Actinotalea sp. M2MS4P-6]